MKYLWLLFFSLTAQAEEGFLGYGGDNKSKFFSLGIREYVMDNSYFQAKAGYFGDAYASLGGGVRINFNGLETRAGLGLCILSAGTMVGTNGEVYLGLKDSSRKHIGVQYENIGSRDFISIQLSLDF